MRKTGEILKGQTGTYLIEGDILIQGEVGKPNPKHNYIVSRCTGSQYRPSTSFKPLKSFQFKKEALAFIEEQEKNYSNSLALYRKLLLSGLITREDFQEKIQQENWSIKNG